MKTTRIYLPLFVLTTVMTGCKPAQQSVSQDATPSKVITIEEAPPETDDHGHGHAHPDHGPHGGELVELGKEEYHIEITHDSGPVTFYVLDGAVVEAVAIDAPKLMVSLKHEGEVKSFELDADRQAEDAEGKSSRFRSDDQQFSKWMNAHAEGAVMVSVQGKSYTGKITHDHEGHDHDDHAHDDHEHGDHGHDSHEHGDDDHDHSDHDHDDHDSHDHDD